MEDAAVAHQLLNNNPDAIKITSDELIYPIVIGLGVNKNNPELRASLEDALAAIQESGKYQELLDKYGLRSEEHTSELQSRGHLVCRLLLEKKKIIKVVSHTIIRRMISHPFQAKAFTHQSLMTGQQHLTDSQTKEIYTARDCSGRHIAMTCA